MAVKKPEGAPKTTEMFQEEVEPTEGYHIRSVVPENTHNKANWYRVNC